jgi:hypothetical protein
VSLQISIGAPAGEPADETRNCSVLDAVANAEAKAPAGEVVATALAYEPLRKSKSKPRSEFESDVSYQGKSVPCR